MRRGRAGGFLLAPPSIRQIPKPREPSLESPDQIGEKGHGDHAVIAVDGPNRAGGDSFGRSYDQSRRRPHRPTARAVPHSVDIRLHEARAQRRYPQATAGVLGTERLAEAHQAVLARLVSGEPWNRAKAQDAADVDDVSVSR